MTQLAHPSRIHFNAIVNLSQRCDICRKFQRRNFQQRVRVTRNDYLFVAKTFFQKLNSNLSNRCFRRTLKESSQITELSMPLLYRRRCELRCRSNFIPRAFWVFFNGATPEDTEDEVAAKAVPKLLPFARLDECFDLKFGQFLVCFSRSR